MKHVLAESRKEVKGKNEDQINKDKIARDTTVNRLKNIITGI